MKTGNPITLTDDERRAQRKARQEFWREQNERNEPQGIEPRILGAALWWSAITVGVIWMAFHIHHLVATMQGAVR